MYVKIYSYNVDLINEFVKLLKKEAKNCNIKDLKGPIFLPVNKKKYSVLRSPHIFSKSK
jgi:ribosomal protein S10